MLDHQSYGERIWAKTYHETKQFIKRRLLFGVCMGVIGSIALGLFGKAHLSPLDIARNAGIVVGSYVFVLLTGFLINLGRAPGLLDGEREATISDLTAKLQAKELSSGLHSKFAALMNEGKELSDNISWASESDAGSWAREREAWKTRVDQALTDMGFPTDASAFLHAAEKATPATGVWDVRSQREFYRREMTCYRDQLQAIVVRRLP
jgi:hypothetical protein